MGRRTEPDHVAVRVLVRALSQRVGGVAHGRRPPPDPGPRLFHEERIGIVHVEVGDARGAVPLRREVQIDTVSLGEAVVLMAPIRSGCKPEAA